MNMTGKVVLSTMLIAAIGTVAVLAAGQGPPFEVRVEVEEEFCQHELTNNGAGMFWHAACTEIARLGDKVFVSALEVVPGCAPLNNVRWVLYERRSDGWHVCRRDLKDRSREPSPLCVSHSGRLLMSVNPTLAPWIPLSADPKAKPIGGPSRPEFLEFDPSHPEQEPRHLLPQWEGEAKGEGKFNDHSYRAFATDGENGEFILFQVLRLQSPVPYYAWALLERDGKWKSGLLTSPKVTDPKLTKYGQWMTVPYASVILSNRQVHYFSQSRYDFWNRIDPLKPETYGRKVGWPMRKLHYAWTPDITTTPFSNWVVVDDTMDDGGSIGVGDSWLAPDGRVHLAYQKEPIHPGLRDRYFPDIKRDWRLCYAILKEGKLLEKRVLFAGGETTGPLQPTGYIGHPRFHVTPEHTLYIIYNMEGTTPQTKAQSGTYAVRIEKEGAISAPVRIPLKCPATSAFFTATPRCGNQPSEVADLLIREIIDGKPHARYARLRFCQP